MKKINLEQVKRIQLEILDEVHQYCQSNQLTYFLSDGTLIGAVRHKGYIPWDDDIDICMPRESYDRFLFSYKHPNGRYKVNEVRLNDGYTQPFIKIEDTNTILIDPKVKREHHLGINIDIFPVDYVVNNNFILYSKFYLKRLLRYIYTARTSNLSHSHFHKYKKTFLLKFLSIIFPIPPAIITKFIIWLVKRTKPSLRVSHMANYKISGCFDASSIISDVDIEFEGRLYKTMVGYKDYLEHAYGDYMKLPPVEHRVPSHQGDAFIKEE